MGERREFVGECSVPLCVPWAVAKPNFLTNMVLTKVVKKKKFDKGADILFCALTPINGSVV